MKIFRGAKSKELALPSIEIGGHKKDSEWCFAYYRHIHIIKIIIWFVPRWWNEDE